jgi:putative spermidine/putrescine transport system ATP-binding protein
VSTEKDAAPRAGGSDRSAVGVQLIDLCRSFGPTLALNNLTIDITPGEFVAFLGPSGCGKTTALRIVAGLDDANSGQVLVGGKDIQNVPASKRDMGMVFQAYSLFPNLTARDNVAFGLRMRSVHRAARRQKADEMLRLVGLGAHSARYPNQLSGGQQQRVALARALAIQPRVLLLDEPLSALDAKVRGELRDEIRRIHQEVGTTTIFVTHDQEEAFTLADRVAVINEGRLQQIGPPTEIYERPRTEFVAEFVGLTNRLQGTAHDGSVSVLNTTVPLLEGSVPSGEVIVLVRPEALRLASGTDGNGRVVSVSFRGSICMLRVRLITDQLVVVQMPSVESTQFSPGTAVNVTVRSVPVLAVAAGRGPSERPPIDGSESVPSPDVSEPVPTA